MKYSYMYVYTRMIFAAVLSPAIKIFHRHLGPNLWIFVVKVSPWFHRHFTVILWHITDIKSMLMYLHLYLMPKFEMDCNLELNLLWVIKILFMKLVSQVMSIAHIQIIIEQKGSRNKQNPFYLSISWSI